MLYTCCNSSRNVWQRSGGCGCMNTVNTTNGGCGCGCTNTTNTTNGGGNTFVNGVYGIFFPISNRSCCVRRTTTINCGNTGGWTNGCGFNYGCRRNLCTTNTSAAVIDGDAYYARQYGLYSGGGCGYYGNTTFNGYTTND